MGNAVVRGGVSLATIAAGFPNINSSIRKKNSTVSIKECNVICNLFIIYVVC